jgi:hypothetical protein
MSLFLFLPCAWGDRSTLHSRFWLRWHADLCAGRCEACLPVPAERSLGAGAFVALDTRRTGDSQRFTDREPKAWAAEQAMSLEDLAERTTPLVIYVHGFRTAQSDAVSTGKVLRAGLAGIAAPGAAPDVLVFGWPTELGLRFSKAQENAPAPRPISAPFGYGG